MKALKVGLIILGALLALVVVGIFGFEVWLKNSRIEPAMEQHRAEIARHVDAFRQDVSALQRHAFFQDRAQGADAGSVLAEQIGWSGVDRKTVLSREQRDLLVGFPGQLQDLEAARALAASSDTQWIKELRAFGHWELDGHGPYVGEKTILPWSVELPNFHTLRNWGRLHLIRLHHQMEQDALTGGEALKAGLDDVRHLGFLCLSTETLIGAMVAVAIFDEVDSAVELYFGSPELRVFSSQELALMKRSFFAAPALLSPHAGEEITQAFIKEAAHWPGLCPALTEAAGSQLPMAPLLQDLFPGYGAGLAAAVRAEQPGCRSRVARRFARQFDPARWSVEDAIELMYNTQSGGADIGHEQLPFTWRVLIKIPGMATALGGILSEIATPASFSHYSE